ncbi:MAG: metallophosphoesterase [Ignavibacteriae bacterium]|nr:metallophosphoesterase [Ignavibacteriota bacterium]
MDTLFSPESLALYSILALITAARSVAWFTVDAGITRTPSRGATMLAAALLCLSPVLQLVYAGHLPPDNPLAPGGSLRFLLIAATCGAGIVAAQFLITALPLFVLRAAARKRTGRWSARTRRTVAVIALLLYGTCLVVVPARFVSEARTIRVGRADIRAGLGAPIRIAILGDTQLDEYLNPSSIRAAVDSLNNFDPDIVLFVGDVALATRRMTFVPAGAALLAPLRARLLKAAVLGDHDLWAGWAQKDSVAEQLRAAGFTVLDNTGTLVVRGTDTVRVVGITQLTDADIGDAALRGLLTQDTTHPIIVLAHQCPAELLKTAEEAGVILVAGGHTHGGQIRFWFYGLMLSSASLRYPVVSGYDRRGSTLVYVSPGIGYSLVPLRYNASGGVGCVTLR